MLLARLRRTAIDTRPLSIPAFRRIWLGNAIAFVGFQVTSVAVAVQVYGITRSSAWVGALGLVGLVPLIAFGLYGGAVADAVDRRRLLLASSLLLWFTTLVLLVQALLGLESVPLLLALVALQSLAFGVSSPTRGAIVPRLLPASLVASANTLNFTTTMVAGATGPLLAGAVLARSGVAAAYALDAALFTAMLWATLRLPPVPPEGAPSVPGLRSVVEGLAFIATRPVLLLSFAVDIVAMVLAMPRALFPEVADTRFGGAGAVGWLYAAIPIGSVVAGLASGWIGRVHRQGRALILAVVVWGAAVAGSGLAGRLEVAVLLLAVGGAADLVSAVYRQTILQVYAPDDMRGRMQGVFVVVVAGGPRLGDIRAGGMAAVVGATASWVWGGVACVVVVLVVAALGPALRHYVDPTAGESPEPSVPGVDASSPVDPSAGAAERT